MNKESGARRQDCPAGCAFSIHDLGGYRPLAELNSGLPADVWQSAQAETTEAHESAPVPGEVQRLVAAREEARRKRDWPRADQLREQIQ